MADTRRGMGSHGSQKLSTLASTRIYRPAEHQASSKKVHHWCNVPGICEQSLWNLSRVKSAVAFQLKGAEPLLLAMRYSIDCKQKPFGLRRSAPIATRKPPAITFEKLPYQVARWVMMPNQRPTRVQRNRHSAQRQHSLDVVGQFSASLTT